MDNHALFLKIENDVIANAVFEKRFATLALLAITIGLGMGAARGVVVSFKPDYLLPSSIAAFAVAFCAAGMLLVKSCSRTVKVSVRYFCGVLFLVSVIFARSQLLGFSKVSIGSELAVHSHNDFRCFLFGAIPSAILVVISFVLQLRAKMAPSHRVRIITTVIAASAGLLEQLVHCPNEKLSHLFMAHCGLVLATFGSMWILDYLLVQRWVTYPSQLLGTPSK
jgi:hypothetical protein